MPYEKGFNLLFHLENVFGRERFEAFVKHWIQKHKYTTVNTEMLQEQLKQYFKDPEDEAKHQVC